MLKYVIITPARNEEATIELTIKAMLSQTVKPEKWIIVSDGSTDKTDDIIENYTASTPWIYYIRASDNKDRDFSAKARCFELGYKLLKDVDYDIIGNLDADITFDHDYIEFILKKISEDEKLGVAGTPFREDGYNSLVDSQKESFMFPVGASYSESNVT